MRGQRSLEDYRLWDRKELDTTEHTHTYCIADCVSWVPRLTVLDLPTNWTYEGTLVGWNLFIHRELTVKQRWEVRNLTWGRHRRSGSSWSFKAKRASEAWHSERDTRRRGRGLWAPLGSPTASTRTFVSQDREGDHCSALLNASVKAASQVKNEFENQEFKAATWGP